MPSFLPELLFWSAAACCLVGQSLVLRSLLALRSSDRDLSPTGPPAGPPAGSPPRKQSGVELVWALLPAIALALVLYATWNNVRSHASQGAPAAAGVAAAGD
jgi:hypothetical protein